jgi:hypothetical protein
MHSETRLWFAFGALLFAGSGAVAVVGCSEDGLNPANPRDRRSASGGDAGTDTDGPSCDQTYAGPSATRRLTRFEYDNTVRDLVGDTSLPASSFPPEELFYGFDNNATDRGVSLELATQYMYAAEKIATNAAVDTMVPCDATKTGATECARQFITSFGKRAYRRPLQSTEVDSLLTTFDAGNVTDFATGIRYVLQRVLQSPDFLYRVETSGPAENTSGDAAKKMIPLTGFEVASRLSYFIWGTMPDGTLFAAADANALGSKEQVAAQARRMLQDPRARDVVKKFHQGWLNLGAVDAAVKSTTAYPMYSADLLPLMQSEAERFAEDVIFDGKGDLTTLFTASYTFVNDKLAPLYGLQNVTGSNLQRVELDPSRRSGILTQLGFLTATAKANQTSPILRGKFVRTQLLCQTIPSPPAGVVVEVGDPQPGQTTRERFAAHTQNPACGGCHQLLDPVGFGFEHYDGIGAWRDDDQGPIDATGNVSGTSIGAFDGAVDLGKKLASSPEAQKCVARQWFRFQAGRLETTEDKCTLQQLDDGFKKANFDIRELVVALTQTDGFLFRAPNP